MDGFNFCNIMDLCRDDKFFHFFTFHYTLNGKKTTCPFAKISEITGKEVCPLLTKNNVVEYLKILNSFNLFELRMIP